MKQPDSHLTDEQLLLELEGELAAGERRRAQQHLAACWPCRARRGELEQAIAGYLQVHGRAELPPAAGPRALLRARLAEVSTARPASSLGFLKAAAAVLAILALGIALGRLREGRENRDGALYSMPDSRLTPGATVLLNRSGVCAQPGESNRTVPVSLQRQVFQEYGIPRADPRAYEVDYLVTPALGGADDIHNLWPHAHAAVWNARVKDALEERLRDLVCHGSLDLGEAQREIATDWISAYRKYFHSNQPLPEHRGPLPLRN